MHNQLNQRHRSLIRESGFEMIRILRSVARRTYLYHLFSLKGFLGGRVAAAELLGSTGGNRFNLIREFLWLMVAKVVGRSASKRIIEISQI